MRTAIKKIGAAVAGDDKQAASETYRASGAIIDRMAGKGLIHKNKAARHKRRLHARLRAM